MKREITFYGMDEYKLIHWKSDNAYIPSHCNVLARGKSGKWERQVSNLDYDFAVRWIESRLEKEGDK